ncbi:MAG: hypothetical protein J5848_07095 [Bacteroidales bacterium]|nr:hypothetical protein [Bacteroidales bacterium]
MLISSIIVLTILLIIFRVLRGESIGAIHREIKELKAKEVPHYFLKSIKIVFSFQRPRFLCKNKKTDNGESDDK